MEGVPGERPDARTSVLAGERASSLTSLSGPTREAGYGHPIPMERPSTAVGRQQRRARPSMGGTVLTVVPRWSVISLKAERKLGQRA